jgi:hypothetical protein
MPIIDWNKPWLREPVADPQRMQDYSVKLGKGVPANTKACLLFQFAQQRLRDSMYASKGRTLDGRGSDRDVMLEHAAVTLVRSYIVAMREQGFKKPDPSNMRFVVGVTYSMLIGDELKSYRGNGIVQPRNFYVKEKQYAGDPNGIYVLNGQTCAFYERATT